MTGYVRRVVTGHDANGKSIVISDGAAPFVHSVPIRPGYFSTDIFRTFETPANIFPHQEETTLGPRRQLPTKNGSVLRINYFPPEVDGNQHMDLQTSKALFESLGNPSGSSFERTGRHPLMHRTETIDYAIILSGEITMLLDESEVLLKTGDILIQCGTDHAWTNRSKEACIVAFILIDGKFDNELEPLIRPKV